MFKVILEQTKDGVKTQDTSYIYGTRPLLSELEDEHILINHNCRQGHCGSCILNLLKGEVRHKPSLIPLSDGEILACQCVPISDLVVAVR